MIIPPEIQQYIIEHYPTEGSKPIALKFNLPQQLICEWAHRRLKIHMTKDARQKIRNNPRLKEYHKYNVNPEQFLNIISPGVAYILGFLWADGHLNEKHSAQTIILNIVKCDFEDIESLFDKTGKWRKYYAKDPKHPTWKERVMAMTNNRIVFQHLKSLDYTSRSASPTKILSHIPEHLRHYWWRGYFDGDGNLYIGKYCHQITFASTYTQNWEFAINLCDQLNVRYTIAQSISSKGHKSSALRICGIENCKILGAYLYQGYDTDGIGLKRKHAKYAELSILKAKPVVSSYVGVWRHKGTNMWGARIIANKVNGLTKNIHLGQFTTAEEANRVRLAYVTRHNIPQYEKKQHKIYDQTIKTHD